MLTREEVNVDGPNLIEGDVTFRRMGLYTKWVIRILSHGCELVQVSVKGGKLGKVTVLKGFTVKLSESAEFFPHRPP